MKSEVSVLIPAYNEADRILSTIQAVKKINLVTEVIVVDDGSEDKTAVKSKEAGVKVICNSKNQGKGGALNRGIEYLTNDFVLLLDADLQKSAQKANKLLSPVIAGRSDMTVAQFSVSSNGGFGLTKKLAQYGLQQFTGRKFAAPLSGQRAVRKDILTSIEEFAPGYGVEVALTIDAWRAGYKIEEIPITMQHRTAGKELSGFYHRGKQFKDILRVLVTK